ncbi:5'-nucleotidase [Curtobacterium sp. 9128]|uniref:bifunctional metallophosphatase/5'-nucleotidase n=1 Tax=Curtobacterium sp. 9128 TaxID=1793722 RepID=UPI0007D71CB2|nr:bifunctional UDP-sugar hydrolase/5'-nucleotidase [Curtobacterium sp. 9128]SBN64478.1 5'-nucleotidase [Curtobacterium sp. 9128]
MNTSHLPGTPSTRRRRGVVTGAALATAGVLVALSVPSSAVAADEVASSIDIYDVNDFHGRIESGSGTAGAAVLAGAVEQLRTANPASAFVSAGDNVGASTFTSFVQDDQPTIDALNAIGLSVSAIGNHELDKGQDDLRDRIIGPDDARNAKYDHVSANLVKKSDGTPAFDPYEIEEIGGVRVGFIGATTELIPELVSPAGIEGLEMADIVDSVNKYADQLTDGDESNDEADALVLLVHEGAADASLASATGDNDFGHIAKDVTAKVSVIFSGHTHQLYNHAIVPTDGTTARPVLQTGSYGGYLGHAKLTIDPTTKKVTAATAENISLTTGAYPADPEITKLVSDAKAVADVKGRVVLGTIDQDMLRAKQTDGSENRGGESTLGNFIAEVQRKQTERNGSQIAFMNPGGLRTDMTYKASGNGEQDGEVTYQEAAGVQPFANTLVVLDLTGDQIRRALEQQWQPTGSSRPFLKLGTSKGFSYTYDPTAAVGSKITDMQLDGTPIDAGTTYKVTVNSFLASGGDNFGAFNEASAKADSGTVDLQAQVDYFTATPDVVVNDDQGAVGVTVTPTPDGGFQAGDEVTVGLTSLTFSNAADQGGTVSVSAGDQELASADIDTTIVDTTDEQGRATLTFPVPGAAAATPAAARAPGAVTLAAAVTPAATTEEPLVVTLPNGQQITLAATVPVPVATDPTDPTDPGTPGAGGGTGDGVGNGTGGTGTGTDVAGNPTASGSGTGALAYTGAELAAPAVIAGLLLLAGLTTMVIARRKRAQARASAQAD